MKADRKHLKLMLYNHTDVVQENGIALESELVY